VLPGPAPGGIVECELGRFGTRSHPAGEVEVVLRPESVAIGVGSTPYGHADAIDVQRAFFGHDQHLQLELPSGLRLRSRRLGFPAWHPGDRVRVWIDGPVNAIEPDRG
jgi:hypothetical protein